MGTSQNTHDISDTILDNYPHVIMRREKLLSYFPDAIIHILEPKEGDSLLVRLDRDVNSANIAKNERESVVKISGSDRIDAVNFALVECLGPLRIYAARSGAKPTLYVHTQEPILAVEGKYTDAVIQKIITQSSDVLSAMCMQSSLSLDNEKTAAQIDKISHLMDQEVHPQKIFAERGNLFVRPDIDELYKQENLRDDILQVGVSPHEMLNHYRALYTNPGARMFPIYQNGDTITSRLVINMHQALAIK